MLLPLNRDLVKEFYLIIKSYQLQVAPLSPKDHVLVSGLMKSLGGIYFSSDQDSFCFFKNATTQQLAAINHKVGLSMLAATMGLPNQLSLEEVYDGKRFWIPVKIGGGDLLDIDICINVHSWAALLSACKEESIFVLLARMPDQDYTIPLSEYRYPAGYPFNFSPDVMATIVPDEYNDLEIGMVEMTPTEMFKYPMITERLIR